jgi:hypothetical protein
MSPKDGKAGTIVAPIDPKAAEEAGVADPGEFEKMVFQQVKTQTGRFGKAKIAAHKPPPEDPAEKSEEKKVTWIEIELKDDANQPMAGEPYELVTPSGETVASGTLDEKGHARVEGIDPGSCKVRFPNHEDDQWRKG